VLAVGERGQIVRCGCVDLKYTGAFLQLRLPSGRKLSYPQPRITEDERNKYHVVFADNAAGRFTDCRNGDGAFGGLWCENVVSGIARDLLAEAMLLDRNRRLLDRAARARRSRVRGADRLRQHRRIHPSHDMQASLGAGSANHS
jgi:hypothetical protein